LFASPRLPLWWIGVFECLSVAAAGAICIARARRCSPARLSRDALSLRDWRRHSRAARALGLAPNSWAALTYLPTVLLARLATGEQVGWFTASHRMVMGLHTFVWLYFFNLLPSIARCVQQPKSNLRFLLSGSLRLTGILSLLGALVATV